MTTIHSFKQNLSPAWSSDHRLRGNYYLREIISRCVRNLALLQPIFKFAARHPFYLNHLYLFTPLQTLNKGMVPPYIHRKQREHSTLIFQGQYKERSLQKNTKIRRNSFKKKKKKKRGGSTKIKSLRAKP